MKKIVLILSFVMLNVVGYSKGLNIKLGSTFLETIKAEVDGELNGDSYFDEDYISGNKDYSLELTYEFQYKENIDLGFGYSTGSGDTIFVDTKYYIKPEGDMKRYYIAKIGLIYSDSMEKYLETENETFEEDWKSENFYYLAFAGGIEKNNKTLELGFEVLKGKMDFEDGDTKLEADILIPRLSIQFGYRFDLGKLKTIKLKKENSKEDQIEIEENKEEKSEVKESEVKESEVEIIEEAK